MKNKSNLKRIIAFILGCVFILIPLLLSAQSTNPSGQTEFSLKKRITENVLKRLEHVAIKDEDEDSIISEIGRHQNTKIFIRIVLEGNHFISVTGKQGYMLAGFMYFIAIISYILAHIVKIIMMYIHGQDGKKKSALFI
jgi:hypothetical protein